MTPNEISVIQASFAKIARMDAEAGQIFYDRLFVIAPELRPMFKHDTKAQARKLMDTLALTVGQLRFSAMLHSTLKSLGERHAGYGVQPEHYEPVGEALIWTIEHCLGRECSDEVRSAWLALYGRAAAVMKEAAHAKDTPPRQP